MDARSNSTNIKGQSLVETETDKSISALAAMCKANMDDDFNTAKTIATLFEMATLVNSIRDGNIPTEQVSASSIALLQQTFETYLIDIFGLTPIADNQDAKLDDVIQILIQIRKESKVKKDFATSDRIRNELLEKGIQLKDEKDGNVSWSV